MNPSPDPLDLVLKALTSTQSPAGMEQRILSAIEQRASEPAAASQRPLWLRSIYLKPMLALTFTFAATAIFLAFLFHQRSISHPEPPPASEDAAAFNMPSLGIDAETAGKIDPMPKPVLSPTPLPLPAPNALAAMRDTPPPPSRLLTHLASSPAPLAAAATRASFPAPPMPLTHQEELLLRIAHRDDPQALAAMTPEHFAADRARDNAAFQDFFPPPTPVDYPTLISQVNPPAQTPTHGASK